MKRKLEIAQFVLVVAVSTLAVFWSMAYAAPGDVEITLVIPAAKVVEFQTGFLAMCPIPIIEDPNGQQTLQYTPKQWIKEWLRRQAVRAYRHGKNRLAQEAAIIDPNVIQR